MKKNSSLMSFFLLIGMESIAWSLRRFHTPVKRHDLVLEVGSGGNPYPRSNVLLDAYESTRERHWAPLTSDRPTVIGFVENLPFRDNSFDFVIASHVLEHSLDPEKFIAELQRVAKSGYIEVPDAFLERINPYRDHRLEITVRDDSLIIFKKKSWIQDLPLVELYEDRVKKYLTKELIPRRPFKFHVRYFWTKKIQYKVLNPQDNIDWEAPKSHHPTEKISKSSAVREWLRVILRNLLSQRRRNREIDLMNLIRCTACHSENMIIHNDHIECGFCGESFLRRNGLVVMNKVNQIRPEPFYS